jgi:hypothetical protein
MEMRNGGHKRMRANNFLFRLGITALILGAMPVARAQADCMVRWYNAPQFNDEVAAACLGGEQLTNGGCLADGFVTDATSDKQYPFNTVFNSIIGSFPGPKSWDGSSQPPSGTWICRSLLASGLDGVSKNMSWHETRLQAFALCCH